MSFWQFTPPITPFFTAIRTEIHKNGALADFRRSDFPFNPRYSIYLTPDSSFFRESSLRRNFPDFPPLFLHSCMKTGDIFRRISLFSQKLRSFFRISPVLFPKSTPDSSPFMPTFSRKHRHEFLHFQRKITPYTPCFGTFMQNARQLKMGFPLFLF